MSNPYRIEQPFIVSFSGGRTSAFMLRQILDAHGGMMPAKSAVVFNNTGKERKETYDFIERVSQQWGVEVIWLEYCKAAPHKFLVMGYASASREGQPFDQLISSKGMLPNIVHRYCTQWLKIKLTNRYARHVLGWTPKQGGYTNCVGLRADEPRRVAKLKPDPKSSPGEEPIAPMATAKHTLLDVEEFWKRQPFKLELRPDEGNCDLCFLKGQGKLLRIMAERPDLAEWWIRQERDKPNTTILRKASAGRFRMNAPSYAATLAKSKLPGLFDVCDTDTPDCRCTD